MLHINVLRNFGCEMIAEGSGIELVAQESDRGLQATEILSILPPTQTEINDSHGQFASNPDEVLDGPWEPARIKWFDKLRGFGFANIFGSSDDVFVHMEVVRQCNLYDLHEGEAIAVRTREGPRGKMVSDIKPWEAPK